MRALTRPLVVCCDKRMPTMIFVNQPVKDLDKSKAFWEKLGYSFNPQFSDENAACLVISDTIFAMLLKEDFFKTFTNKQIADTRTTTEGLVYLSVEDKREVDVLVDKAIAAGATEPKSAMDDGGMYMRTFDDLGGHTWEIGYMDPSAIQD